MPEGRAGRRGRARGDGGNTGSRRLPSRSRGPERIPSAIGREGTQPADRVRGWPGRRMDRPTWPSAPRSYLGGDDPGRRSADRDVTPGRAPLHRPVGHRLERRPPGHRGHQRLGQVDAARRVLAGPHSRVGPRAAGCRGSHRPADQDPTAPGRLGAGRGGRRLGGGGGPRQAGHGGAADAADRRSCRAGSASGWRWPQPSSPPATCWCWTSRPTTSTSRGSAWLEDRLDRFRGGLLLVTHDRHLLDRLTTGAGRGAGGAGAGARPGRRLPAQRRLPGLPRRAGRAGGAHAWRRTTSAETSPAESWSGCGGAHRRAPPSRRRAWRRPLPPSRPGPRRRRGPASSTCCSPAPRAWATR